MSDAVYSSGGTIGAPGAFVVLLRLRITKIIPMLPVVTTKKMARAGIKSSAANMTDFLNSRCEEAKITTHSPISPVRWPQPACASRSWMP